MNKIEYVIHNEKLQEIGLTPLVKCEAKSLIHISQKDASFMQIFTTEKCFKI